MDHEFDDFLTSHAIRWGDDSGKGGSSSRWSKSAADLDQMVATIVREVTECQFCFVGPVVTQPDDEHGINWRISRISGHHCLDCLERIRPQIETLQRCYSLSPKNGT